MTNSTTHQAYEIFLRLSDGEIVSVPTYGTGVYLKTQFQRFNARRIPEFKLCIAALPFRSCHVLAGDLTIHLARARLNRWIQDQLSKDPTEERKEK